MGFTLHIMKDFEICFELYDKKMKTTVSAFNETAAKKIIQDKIIFHKITEITDDHTNVKDFMGNNETFNNLMDILGMNNKK